MVGAMNTISGHLATDREQLATPDGSGRSARIAGSMNSLATTVLRMHLRQVSEAEPIDAPIARASRFRGTRCAGSGQGRRPEHVPRQAGAARPATAGLPACATRTLPSGAR